MLLALECDANMIMMMMMVWLMDQSAAAVFSTNESCQHILIEVPSTPSLPRRCFLPASMPMLTMKRALSIYLFQRGVGFVRAQGTGVSWIFRACLSTNFSNIFFSGMCTEAATESRRALLYRPRMLSMLFKLCWFCTLS